MLQVARLAPRLLGDSVRAVTEFLRAEFNQDGGISDRSGESDLYYTVFGLDGLVALEAELPIEESQGFLAGFDDGQGLDLVELSCLARCWAALGETLAPTRVDAILSRVEKYRSADGGYAPVPAASTGTCYHCFLALGAYQDLAREMPSQQGLSSCLQALKTEDGGFSNVASATRGLTTATAAAVAILRQLDSSLPAGLDDWLLGMFHRQGGFRAVPEAPVPDLLSTATALHTLTSLGVDLAPVKEPCLDFLDSLWNGRAFCGSWSDGTVDAEYTYYGLLSLGHLSL